MNSNYIVINEHLISLNNHLKFNFEYLKIFYIIKEIR